jgi:PhnB protein
MSLSVYLNFGGNCRQAIEFYCEVFRLPMPSIMKYGDSPDGQEMSDKDKELVMYADLTINGTLVMFGDIPEWFPMKFKIGNNMAIYVRIHDMEEVTRLYNELLDGGKVVMELAPTFWSKSYGYVIDKFGIPWMLGYEER